MVGAHGFPATLSRVSHALRLWGEVPEGLSQELQSAQSRYLRERDACVASALAQFDSEEEFVRTVGPVSTFSGNGVALDYIREVCAAFSRRRAGRSGLYGWLYE